MRFPNLRRERFRRTVNQTEDPDLRALRLLKAHLNEYQLHTLMKYNYFDVLGNRNGRYRIAYSRSVANVMYMRRIRRNVRLCVVPMRALPLADVILGQKLLIETDEKWFRTEACRYSAADDRSDHLFTVSQPFAV